MKGYPAYVTKDPPHDPEVSVGETDQPPLVEKVEPTLEDVFGVMSTVAEPTSKGRRQLVVDQKPHATSTTTWFVCWAA